MPYPAPEKLAQLLRKSSCAVPPLLFYGAIHETQTGTQAIDRGKPIRHDGLDTDHAGRRYHQGWHPALLVRDHGYLGNVPEGRGADDHTGDQRQWRRDGQATGSRSGRPRIKLAAVCREGPSAAGPGPGIRRLWRLDLGIAEIGAAGLQGA